MGRIWRAVTRFARTNGFRVTHMLDSRPVLDVEGAVPDAPQQITSRVLPTLRSPPRSGFIKYWSCLDEVGCFFHRSTTEERMKSRQPKLKPARHRTGSKSLVLSIDAGSLPALTDLAIELAVARQRAEIEDELFRLRLKERCGQKRVAH